MKLARDNQALAIVHAQVSEAKVGKYYFSSQAMG